MFLTKLRSIKRCFAWKNWIPWNSRTPNGMQRICSFVTKKRNYYLITVKGDKRVDLKLFRKAHGLRPLSFASAEDLLSVLGLLPGSVTPFGFLNDAGCSVRFYFDQEFLHQRIGVHPNDNTATVWMQADDLLRLIQEHGNEAEFTEIQLQPIPFSV